MDFLKGLFKRGGGRGKAEAGGAPIEMGLNEAERRLHEKISRRKDDALKRLAPAVDEILKQKRAAKEVIQELAERDFDEDIKERTYKPILTSKPVYIRGMLEGLKGIRDQRPEDYEGLEAFYAGVTKALKSIQTVQLKQGRYMKYAFEKEVLRLGSVLNRIIDESVRLEEEVGHVAAFAREAQQALDRIGVLREELGRAAEAEAGKRMLMEKVRACEEELQSADGRLQRLESSREFKDYLKMRDELAACSSTRKELEKRLLNALSPLRRPLKKYQKALERGSAAVEPEALEMLGEYVASAKTAVEREDPERPYLEGLLKGLGDAIEKGVVRLDERERKKTLARVEELRGGRLKNMLKELLAAKKREEQIAQGLSRSDLWERRERLAQEKEDLAKEREKLLAQELEKPAQAGDMVKEVKKEIEERMSEMEGRPVVILIPGLEKTEGGRQDL
ncbi:MAG: hypothetical protein D6733_01225 [Methanobacteriota archaeon]|nr:MAG: hypothetical protein D6733_01225 [Euryarchaeota archaeon]